MRLSDRLLRKNMSTPRIIGFALSNFIGLAIILVGLQFYIDAKGLWQSEDSFIKKDYLVVNKRVTSGNTLGENAGFSATELADIDAQPWVRKTGVFTSADFRVSATLDRGGRSMSTYMFLEAIPDEFIDAADAGWHYSEGDKAVPIIISKDYLTLYNFGFATSAGMPQLSEGLMSSIPMTLTLRGERSDSTVTLPARITGYSNRLNTILVPGEFIRTMNARLGSGKPRDPSRIIIDVSSPGDTAIEKYLSAHNLETAGDKSGSQASFLLKVVTGIILTVGIVITILSFFILLLSISLLMEKNRDKMHTLIMLGYPLRTVGAPFRRIILIASAAALILAVAATFAVRAYYIGVIADLGGNSGNIWTAPAVGLILTAAVILFNVIAVKRKVAAAFR